MNNRNGILLSSLLLFSTTLSILIAEEKTPQVVTIPPQSGGKLTAEEERSLKPGLAVYEFNRTDAQVGKDGAFVEREKLGDPLSQSKVTTSTQWNYNEKNNALATGLLKIDIEGEYAFQSVNYYDRNALYLDGKVVCKYRDGEQKVIKIKLTPGYLPIDSIGYVLARGSVKLLWQPAGEEKLVVIPADRLFHRPDPNAPAKPDNVQVAANPDKEPKPATDKKVETPKNNEAPKTAEPAKKDAPKNPQPAPAKVAKPEMDLSTPEAAFEAYVSAVAARDWTRMMQTLTVEGQVVELHTMLQRADLAVNGKLSLGKEFEPLREQLAELYRKHNLPADISDNPQPQNVLEKHKTRVECFTELMEILACYELDKHLVAPAMQYEVESQDNDRGDARFFCKEILDFNSAKYSQVLVFSKGKFRWFLDSSFSRYVTQVWKSDRQKTLAKLREQPVKLELSSPQETFATFRDSLIRGHWTTAIECVSIEDSRDLIEQTRTDFLWGRYLATPVRVESHKALREKWFTNPLNFTDQSTAAFYSDIRTWIAKNMSDPRTFQEWKKYELENEHIKGDQATLRMKRIEPRKNHPEYPVLQLAKKNGNWLINYDESLKASKERTFRAELQAAREAKSIVVPKSTMRIYPREVLHSGGGIIHSMTFSDNSQYLILGPYAMEPQIWNNKTQSLSGSFPKGVEAPFELQQERKENIRPRVAWSPQGKTLFIAGGGTKESRYLQRVDGNPARVVNCPAPPFTVADLKWFGKDRIFLQGTGQKTFDLALFDNPSQKIVFTRQFQNAVPHSFACNSAGTSFALAMSDRVAIHAADGSEQGSIPLAAGERVDTLAFSPDGNTLAIGYGLPRRLDLYDIKNSKVFVQNPELPSRVTAINWLPNAKKLIVCAKHILVIDAGTGQELSRIGESRELAVLSPDGKLLATGGSGPDVQLWDVQDE